VDAACRDSGSAWARWPRVTGLPHPALRAVVVGEYVGYTEVTAPHHLVLPAPASIPLIVKILDSAHRPPAFVQGAHGSYDVVDGDCAPSYLEVRLAPLAAYPLLGIPMDRLTGHPVDLVELLGAGGRRWAERPTWGQRFGLVDQLLLRRVADGVARPAPEVAWAWSRLTATGGATPIRRLAAEVAWSHKHLITKFAQQVGLRPRRWLGCSASIGCWRAWSGAHLLGGSRARPTAATPTKPTWSGTSVPSPRRRRPTSWPALALPAGSARVVNSVQVRSAGPP
jgi:hypothetical protein